MRTARRQPRRARARPGNPRHARSARRRARASRRSSPPSCRAATTMVAASAVAPAAKAIDWPWLPRVALTTARRLRLAPLQAIDVDQPAAQLEGAHRRVVLVLPTPAAASVASSSGQRAAASRHGLRRTSSRAESRASRFGQASCQPSRRTRPGGDRFRRRAGALVECRAQPQATPARRWPGDRRGEPAPFDQRRQSAAAAPPSRAPRCASAAGPAAWRARRPGSRPVDAGAGPGRAFGRRSSQRATQWIRRGPAVSAACIAASSRSNQRRRRAPARRGRSR